MEKIIKRVYPNPAKTVTEIEIISNHDCMAEVQFNDHKGDLVFTVPFKVEINKGNNLISLNLAPLKPGFYSIRIMCGPEVLNTSVEVSR
jgi:hypothetical protein